MLTLDRRMLLRAGSAAVGAAALAPTAPALAHAPQAGKGTQPSTTLADYSRPGIPESDFQ
jgi:Spy/CpxP family protein refolding chaperone